MGLPVAFVFPALKQFLKGVVVETHIVENAYMFAYATLTLLNTLLISGEQQDFLSSGGQKKVIQSLQQASSLNPFKSTHRKELVKYLIEGDEGKELSDRLIAWIASTLEQLSAAYQAGRCSIRRRFENQVKVGAEDYLGEGQVAAGVNLLRPVVNQQATWRWTPLLPDSDEIFELLDRKIPASLLVLC